jgi:Na+/melibiose symporter-like transporter
MRELLRDRRFRLLFIGQVASMAGDSVMLLVLAIWVKELTGSSGMAGAVMLGIAAPALLSPVLGWVVDRVRRRPFLVWTNVASALMLLPLLAVHDRASVWIVYVVACAYGLSFMLNSAGMAGLFKLLVVDDRLADANAALRTVREGLRLVGPLAGAGLYAAVGARVVVLADLASFLVAAASLALLRVPEPPPTRTELHWLAEASAGFRHLFGERALRRCALAVGAALLVFGTVESGVFGYVDQGLHRPPTFVGVLVTVMGVGSIAGGILAPWIIRRIGEPGTVAAGLLALACGLGPLVYPSLPLGVAVVPFLGIGVVLLSVAFATLMQRRTPQALMARVSTASDLLLGVPETVSIAAGAVLVSTVGYRWLFATTTVGLALVAATLWTRRHPVEPVSEPDVVVAPALAPATPPAR